MVTQEEMDASGDNVTPAPFIISTGNTNTYANERLPPVAVMNIAYVPIAADPAGARRMVFTRSQVIESARDDFVAVVKYNMSRAFHAAERREPIMEVTYLSGLNRPVSADDSEWLYVEVTAR